MLKDRNFSLIVMNSGTQNRIEHGKSIRLVLTLPLHQEWFKLPSELKLTSYSISKNGGIKNLHGRISDCKPNASGYIRIKLTDDGGMARKYSLHILVALTFIPNPLNKPCVDHIDRNRHNNHVGNLRWSTHRENNLNRISYSKKSRFVMQKTIDGQMVKIWTSAKEAAAKLDVPRRSIWGACKQRTVCAGFLWEYYYGEILGEIWKNISSNNILIGISSCGRIRLPKGSITVGYDVGGYRMVKIGDRAHPVHQLVLRAFEPRPDYLRMEVNHIDRNKSNNNLSNLEWTTRTGNMEHERNTSTTKRRGPGRKVEQLTTDGRIVNKFSSATEASKITGIVRSNISRVCRGELKSAGKYLWRYY